MLSGGGGGDEPSATTPVSFHIDFEGRSQGLTGDCVSEDVISRTSIEGVVTGDISGRTIAPTEVILYAAESCRRGLARAETTFTDPDGNTLFWVGEGPISLVGEGPFALSQVAALIVTGGSGIYEGATGQSTCTVLATSEFGEDGSQTVQGVTDCQVELSTAGAVTAAQPVILQLGASSTAVELFAVDLPSTVAIVVLYRNTRDDAQRGLILSLPVPEGAQILAAARGEEEPVAGERVWPLPDLPPGEIARFEFTLQFLSAAEPAIPLVVEIDGDGFDGPVQSSPITIEVVQ